MNSEDFKAAALAHAATYPGRVFSAPDLARVIGVYPSWARERLLELAAEGKMATVPDAEDYRVIRWRASLAHRAEVFAGERGLVFEAAGQPVPDATAVYSQDQVYRYLLTREWGPGPVLVWIMLNPSTATAAVSDPTITRCVKRARLLGFGGMAAMNLFAVRATDPAVMLAHRAPAGPANDAALAEFTRGATVLAAWGADGNHQGRAAAVTGALAAAGVALQCLRVLKAGEPQHPLYIPYAVQPVPYAREAA